MQLTQHAINSTWQDTVYSVTVKFEPLKIRSALFRNGDGIR